MLVPNKIIWAEGMLVTPQHMQQQDLYHDVVLQQRLATMHKHAWGVVSLRIDTDRLCEGEIVLGSGRIVLPSGTTFTWDDAAGGAPLQRAWGDRLHAENRRIDVFVGVQRNLEGVANVQQQGNNATAYRYTAFSRPVAELTEAATPAVEVRFGRLMPAIFFDNERHDDLELIKIAELILGQDGRCALDATFVPTCLNLRSFGCFARESRALLERVTNHVEQLETRLRAALLQDRPLEAAASVELAGLCPLRAAQAALQGLVADPDINPYAAYGLLRHIIGLLGAARPLNVPQAFASLPSYDCFDLRRCLGGLLSTANGCIPKPKPPAHTSWPFVATAQGLLHCTLRDIRPGATRWFIVVRCDTPSAQVCEMWPRLVKLAAPDSLAQLVRVATSGIPQVHVTKPPTQLPMAGVSACFEVETRHPGWAEVLQTGALGLMVPTAWGHVQVHLLQCDTTGVAV